MKLETRGPSDDRKPLLEVMTKHWVMDLSTHSSDGPHSTPLYYAVSDDGETLVFTSKPSTRHIQDVYQDSRVSAGIYLETKEIGHIQGVQIHGTVELLEGAEEKRLREVYFKTHPAVRPFVMKEKETRFWVLRVHDAKLINNRFGFGKHIEWKLREEGKGEERKLSNQ